MKTGAQIQQRMTRLKMFFGQAVAVAMAAAALLVLAGGAGAQTSDNLQHLVDTHGSLTIGDKTFGGFGYHDSGLTSFNASNIQVTVSNNGGQYYLTWAGNMSLTSNSGPASADLVLNYNVTATSGLIDMLDQLYTGSAQPQGGAYLSIDETARDANGNLVGNSHLDANDLSDPFAEPGDNLNINPPQNFLSVTKDIGMGISSNSGGFINISEVRQSFHQVPEPGSTAMFLAGLAMTVGMVVLRRSRRQSRSNA
jgi:hypothetical protein